MIDKRYIIGLGVIIVFLTSVILVLQQQSKVQDSNLSVQQKNIQAPIPMETYVNKELGLQFTYPNRLSPRVFYPKDDLRIGLVILEDGVQRNAANEQLLNKRELCEGYLCDVVDGTEPDHIDSINVEIYKNSSNLTPEAWVDSYYNSINYSNYLGEKTFLDYRGVKIVKFRLNVMYPENIFVLTNKTSDRVYQFIANYDGGDELWNIVKSFILLSE